MEFHLEELQHPEVEDLILNEYIFCIQPQTLPRGSNGPCVQQLLLKKLVQIKIHGKKKQKTKNHESQLHHFYPVRSYISVCKYGIMQMTSLRWYC